MSDSSAARQPSRALDLVTAILLGVVSLTTALGAWQASSWSQQAADYGESSSDARDSAITRGVDWQYDSRLDTAAILNAREYAVLNDQAIAADDYRAAAFTEAMVGNYLARILSNTGLDAAFATWRADGFPPDENPTTNPEYLVGLRGEADSFTQVSALAGEFKDRLQGKANIIIQASLVDALALFLLGVAGINRLRSARFATLVLGAAAYIASIFMMLGAY
ncbi:MAG: hypothetical protein ABI566_13835 [Pseudolysinimonas sp.]